MHKWTNYFKSIPIHNNTLYTLLLLFSSESEILDFYRKYVCEICYSAD